MNSVWILYYHSLVYIIIMLIFGACGPMPKKQNNTKNKTKDARKYRLKCKSVWPVDQKICYTV